MLLIKNNTQEVYYQFKRKKIKLDNLSIRAVTVTLYQVYNVK